MSQAIDRLVAEGPPDGDRLDAFVGEHRFPIVEDGAVTLQFTETEKVFDPEEVYGDAPNPTEL